MLAALAVLSGVAVHAADQPPAAATPAPVKIVLHYFGKAYDEPVPLSLVDPILTDNGVQGARLGIQDNNKSGQFLGQDLDAQGNLIFTSDLFLDGGVTAENIKLNAGLFDYLLGELNQFNP